MSEDYADGGVHTLTLGAAELRTILAAAARRSQLVLLDFSASWCGPCRMMVPVLHQLAGEHRGRLAVVKVDCEQTAANRDLAATSGIRAFPTFHLYRNEQKVHEMRGADQAGLRRAIQQQLAQLGPPAAASGRGPMAAALAAALARVKAGCSFDEFVTAAKTLLTFVGNVIDHPGEEKYRRIKLSNAAFQAKLGCRAGGKECMAAIGFREMNEAGEGVLVLPEVPPELPTVRQLLQQALQQAEAAAAAAGAAAAERRVAASSTAPSQPPAPPAAGPAAASGGSSSLDASALARALAAALAGGSSSAGGSAAPNPAARPAAGRQPGTTPARRVLHVTPKRLAGVLARVMRESGITGAPQQPVQQQQDEQQPPPPAPDGA